MDVESKIIQIEGEEGGGGRWAVEWNEERKKETKK
jgi:hypothetical protein